MVQGEGTNPQSGKVTVDDFAAKIKSKYPEYEGVDNLKLAKAIIDKYPEYKDVVTFDTPSAEPVKKKRGFSRIFSCRCFGITFRLSISRGV